MVVNRCYYVGLEGLYIYLVVGFWLGLLCGVVRALHILSNWFLSRVTMWGIKGFKYTH